MPYPPEHLFWSYRLAKFEVASERRGLGRLAFAEYEQSLGSNLTQLRSRLALASNLFDKMDPGSVWIRPKSVERTKRDKAFVTVPESVELHPIDSVSVRVLLEPSPDFATCEILWIRMFGPALEALLDAGCCGNRLDLRDHPPAIWMGGRRVFKYWIRAYRRFRDDALQVAKATLGRGLKRCVLTTLDLTSYYDNIDPEFLVSLDFIAELAQAAALRSLPFDTGAYLAATNGLLAAFQRFRVKVGQVVGVLPRIGIPIGSQAARVIANLALSRLDRYVQSQPQVRYYARYVDDILVVEEPSEAQPLVASETVARLMPLKGKPGGKAYKLDQHRLGRPGSIFEIQRTKLRVFDLTGPEGLEYLAAVESELKRMSSERRRFLDPGDAELDETVIASDDTEPIHALREADALTLRRLAVATACGKVATAAAMLSAEEARAFSRRHLGKVGKLATEWSRWVDLVDVTLRVLGVALQASDHQTANEIVAALLDRSASLDNGKTGAFKVSWKGKVLEHRARTKLREWVEEQLVEVIVAATPFDSTGFTIVGVASVDGGVILRGKRLGPKALLTRARKMAAADLRLADRETDHVLGVQQVRRPSEELLSLEAELGNEAHYVARQLGMVAFLEACAGLNDPVFQDITPVELLLASRPPSYADILLRWMRSGRAVSYFTDVVNAVRGTRYAFAPMEDIGGRLVVRAPEDLFRPAVVDATRVVLGNLCTDKAWWDASLAQPVLSDKRQERFVRVLNHAIYAAITSRGRPTILVLPELSLPRRWVREVCRHLTREVPVLALVAGVEYDVIGRDVYNEALAYVPRPFYSAAAEIWTKRRPADHEGFALKKAGFRFVGRRSTRSDADRFRPMDTEHGVFLPLICSELLEVDTRARLLGALDLLLVPAWNDDTNTFEYHVQATPLELHCFVAVANNGDVSDCRVRAPIAEPAWAREMGRLVARGQNEVLVVDLPVAKLREFELDPVAYLAARRASHSKASPMWPTWKPTPPGWEWRKG